jgi:hypothetical protein
VKEAKSTMPELANQAIHQDPEFALSARSGSVISKSTWLIDSGTASHIATKWEMFTEFIPRTELIQGISKNMQLEGKG